MWYTAPLILGAMKAGGHLLRKPKQRQPDTGWMQRYINNWRGDVSSSSVQRGVMRDASRQIGANATRTNDKIRDNLARTGNEGLAAASLIQSQQNSNRSGLRALESGAKQQARANARSESKIEQLEMARDRLEAEARQRHNVAMDNWNAGWGGMALETAGSLATSGLSALDAAKKTAEITAQQGTQSELFEKLANKSLMPDDLKSAVAAGTISISEAMRYNNVIDAGNNDKEYFEKAKELIKGSHEWDDGMDAQQNLNLLKLSVPNANGGDNEAYYNELAKLKKVTRPYDPTMTSQQNVNLLNNLAGNDGEQQKQAYYNMSINPNLTEAQVDAAVQQGVITAQMGLNLRKAIQPGDVEQDWYLGEDGLEHRQAKINGRWQDTGETRKANYKAPDTKKRDQAQLELINMENELKIWQKYKTPQTDEKVMDRLIENAVSGDFNQVQDDLEAYVNSLDIPIKGKSSYSFEGADGKTVTFSLEGENDSAKLFNARLKLYQRYSKILMNIRLGMGSNPTGISDADFNSDFDWE